MKPWTKKESHFMKKRSLLMIHWYVHTPLCYCVNVIEIQAAITAKCEQQTKADVELKK